jgi:hypothetical protein
MTALLTEETARRVPLTCAHCGACAGFTGCSQVVIDSPAGSLFVGGAGFAVLSCRHCGQVSESRQDRHSGRLFLVPSRPRRTSSPNRMALPSRWGRGSSNGNGGPLRRW